MGRLLAWSFVGVVGSLVACGDREDCLGSERIAESGADLVVLVENGVYEGQCVYDARVLEPVYRDLDCAVERGECICTGSSGRSSNREDVRFELWGLTQSFLGRPLEDRLVPASEICNGHYEATFSMPPVGEALIPNCQAAGERFADCSVGPVLSSPNCIDTTLALDPEVTCTYGCIAASTCVELDETICVDPAPSEPTALVVCVDECLDLGAADTAWLSEALAADCPD